MFQFARSRRLIHIALTGFVLTCIAAVAVENPNSASSNALPDDVTRIEAETTVAGSRADVWRAWTTNEGLQEFLTPATNVELRLGGPYELYFAPNGPEGERGSEDCKVLSYIPHEMLSFTWNAPPHLKHARQHRTWVVVRFDEHEDGTRVRLVHLGWDEMKRQFPDHAEEWDKARAYFEQAWPFVLKALKDRFDKGPRWDEQGEQRW